jgi:hypothetical protein
VHWADISNVNDKILLKVTCTENLTSVNLYKDGVSINNAPVPITTITKEVYFSQPLYKDKPLTSFTATGNNGAVPVGAGVYIMMPSGDATQSFTVTGLASPVEGGSVVCSPSTVLLGGSTTCAVSINGGYNLGGVSSSCGGALIGGTFVTGAVNSNCTVTAQYGTINQPPPPSGNPPFPWVIQGVTYNSQAQFDADVATNKFNNQSVRVCSISVPANCKVLLSGFGPGFTGTYP